MNNQKEVVLGIDPGFVATGYSIIKKEQGAVCMIDVGCLKMSSSKSIAERIHIFHDFFTRKIIEKQVTRIALETPFLGKNAQNFLKLGYLRGITYLLSHNHKVIMHEFSPREVKASVTGYGGAGKEQVERVVMSLFPSLPPQERLDITDAIAVSLCGVWASSSRL